MGLGAKLNLVLLCVFGLGLALFYFLSAPFLEEKAQQEVVDRARIMMEGAAGIRKYTAEEIAPLLAPHMAAQFYPQTVAAYAARKNFQTLRKQFPEYQYREVSRNPTNPSWRAVEWETEMINWFRDHPDRLDRVTHRDTSDGPFLLLSQPLRVTAKCLPCHGRWETAPASMIAAYGKDNGFGWKEGEVIAAQIVSVPMAIPLQRAHATRLYFMGLLAAVFLALAIVLNILLRVVVINPITEISHIAGDVSMGKADVPEYHVAGSDEIASLSASFNRMRRTVEEAMKMLGESLRQ